MKSDSKDIFSSLMNGKIMGPCKTCGTTTERNKRGRCKPCACASQAAYRAANIDKVRSSEASYRAANQEKQKARSAARYAANPEEMKARLAASHAANPEKQKACIAKWKAANQETVRIYHQNRHARKLKNGGVLSKCLVERLLKLQRGKCACCHVSIEDGNHMDHVIPLALDGPNEDLNIQLLCGPCNMSKGAKHPVDFMQTRGFLL